MKPDLFQAPDYYQIDDLLSSEHKMVRDATREFVKREVSPIIEEAAQTATFPKQILKGLAEIGAFGPYIPEEYGGAGLDQISYGLIMQEIERGDSGIRSTASVQSSLVMYPIWKYGNEEQRKKYLPKLATGEWMGSFGLTEPDHGSNPAGMVTSYKDKGDHYLLNGAKLWISNSPFCDVAVVWAKNEEGRIHGLVVERGMEGFSTPETHNKWSLRASATGELIFQDVKVPKENLLGEEGKGFKYILDGMNAERILIASECIGDSKFFLDKTTEYASSRVVFGRPIGQNQGIQFPISRAYAETEAAALIVDRAAKLFDNNISCGTEANIAKLLSSEASWKAAEAAIIGLKRLGFTKPIHEKYKILDEL